MMKENLLNVVYAWLTGNGYCISRRSLSKMIVTHPDFPSLKAVSDSLSDLGLEFVSLAIPVDRISELVGHFLVYVKDGVQEQLVLVARNEKGCITLFNGETNEHIDQDAFKLVWTGVIVAVDPISKAKSRISSGIPLGALPLLLFFALALILSVHNLANLAESMHLLFSVLGLSVCGIIIYHELGAKSKMLSKFCSLTKNSSCDAVLSSPAAKIFRKIGLGDIGTIFFSSFVVSWLFVGSNAATWIFLASIAAAPFTLFSVWYQWIKVKKWCPLCLSVVLCLWLMLIPAAISLQHANAESWSVWGLLQVSSILALVAIVWAWIKSLLPLKGQIDELERDALSFRRNYHLFLPFFYSQSSVDTEEIDGDICLGNRNALVEILAITNPMCNTCITSHFMYEELLKKYPGEVRLRLRFVVPFTNREDPRTLVAEKMLELFKTLPEEEFRQSLHEWYVSPLKYWLDKRGRCSNSDYYNKVLENQRVWCQKHDVQTTPTMFINGRRFPHFYHPTDLKYMMDEIVEKELNNSRSEGSRMNTLVCDAR